MAKQWFYSNRNVVDTWDKCSNAFLAKLFPVGKANALCNKISSFQQLADESISEAWEMNVRVDYTQGVDYKGLNESVTSVTYHMT
jgi:hypothetical protein